METNNEIENNEDYDETEIRKMKEDREREKKRERLIGVKIGLNRNTDG